MSGIGKNWMIGLGAIVVIAVAGVTVFLVTQPPAAQQQATGAIGAAERHRAEQIKEGDVGVTAPGTAVPAPVTEVDLAEALGRSADEARSSYLTRAADDEVRFVLGRAPDDLRAQYLDLAGRDAQIVAVRQLDAGVQARMIGRLTQAELGRYLAAMKATAADFERLSPGERFNALVKADPDAARIVVERSLTAERGAMLLRLSDAQMREAVSRAAMPLRAETVARSDVEGRIHLLRGIPESERSDLSRRVLAAREQSATLGRATPDLMRQLLDRADVGVRSDILARMSPEMMLRVLGRGDEHLQRQFLERVSAADLGRIFERAGQERVANLVNRADAATRVDAVGRLTAEARQQVLDAARVSADSWGRMAERQRNEALARLDNGMKAQLFRGFSPADQARAFDAAALAERLDLVGRAPEVCANLFGRVDAQARSSFYALTTAAERQDAIGRSGDFERARLADFASRDELARMQNRAEQGRQDQ